MKLIRLTIAFALVGCVQVKERDADSLAARAKIDTSSGLLAVTPGRVDSTAASTVPRTPPLVGVDSATMIRGMGSAAERQALRNDTAVALAIPDSVIAAIVATAPPAPVPPAAIPAVGGSDVEMLRHAMQVPVAGISPSMLHDTYDEMRGGTRRHEALDILATRGTQVVSATNGRVLKLFDSKAGGLMVYAADETNRFILMYGHLDAYQPGLAAGQPLRRGQPLGTVGTTGNAPAGVPHLHFAVARSANVNEWWKGMPVNPYPLLRP
ncbi:MAG: endopeptidase [Gemmatimonadetes bacterium]|jgi:murein DD-endopeptidase MepM/ murein hydrolase activator NlpD|nr:endopeptidase [Gemmatimonadota bacterium]